MKKQNRSRLNETRTRLVSPLPATAAITLQRALPLADLLLVQCFAAAGTVVQMVAKGPRWYGFAAGAGIALLMVVRLRGFSMPRRISERFGFLYQRRQRKSGTEAAEPFDSELA